MCGMTATTTSSGTTQRRGKRDKNAIKTSSVSHSDHGGGGGGGEDEVTRNMQSIQPTSTTNTSTQQNQKSRSCQKHQHDTPSGGMMVLLPSLIGITILICAVMAKMGFRGRPSLCGIDLGTTNSVICIQEQVGGISTTTTSSSSSSSSNLTNSHVHIRCIADPATGSPVVPSVVSFLDGTDRHKVQQQPSSYTATATATATAATTSNWYTTIMKSSNNNKNHKHKLQPDPSHVIVGQAAKQRINTHPHHTLYHAKRVLGRPTTDSAITTLRNEVEFEVVDRRHDENNENNDDHDNDHGVEFRVPDTPIPITPGMVGSYIVHHLVQMVHVTLGHTNVQSAVICVPAKFNAHQRAETVAAFRNAGITVARIVEEPTAAALAYGLHRKPGVDYILVYDFGGGTLDTSLLHVSDGFVDVMGSDGDDRLGGSDFDDVIAKLLLYHDRSSNNGNANVVQTVQTIVQQIQESDIPSGMDVEDVLSHRCPALHKIPLCTVSSYHTLGEELKIGLSEKYNSDEEETIVTAQCLGISKQNADLVSTWTIERFCTALEVVTLTLTSSEFQTISQPLLDRSIIPVQRLLHDLNIKPDDIQEIVMVGGTTRMPQIRHLVQQTFPNSQLNTRIDPDLTVAYGAASVID
jgi:molecular chaperone DnaK (HSP70)